MFKEKAITNKFTEVMLSQSVLLACKSSMFLPSKTFGVSWPTISLRLEKSESHPERRLSFSNVPPQTGHPSPATTLVKLVKIRVLFQPRRQKQVGTRSLEAPHAPCTELLWNRAGAPQHRIVFGIIHYPPCVLKEPFELFGINRRWKARECNTCSMCSTAAKCYLARVSNALA